MGRNAIRFTEPSDELRQKIVRAREAIAAQKTRFLVCPYCRHKAAAVYEDTRGHVETKCAKCGRTTVFDVMSMRRASAGLSDEELSGGINEDKE